MTILRGPRVGQANVSPHNEPELVSLRKMAEELARGRREKTSTAHLLAAIANAEGAAAEMLRERRLDTDILLKAARVATDDTGDAVGRAIERARDFAARSPGRDPRALHLLFALCHDRKSAAYRAIEQCGTDVVKLRTLAMQVAMGIIGPRRPAPPKHPAEQLSLDAARSTRPARAPQVTSPSLAPVRASNTMILPTRTTERKHRNEIRVASLPSTSHAPTLRARRGRVAHEPSATATRGQLDPKRFPTLVSLGQNLTQAALEGKLDPVIGREDEIERTMDILAKKNANSACLVGPPGAGKTSVVRGLALSLVAAKDEGDGERVVIAIDSPSLLVGTGARGALAERIAQVRAEVAASGGRVILFFDDVHALLGREAGDEGAAELKSALARGELPFIGATTPEEYRKTIGADGALARRFSVIDVEEPNAEEALLALESVAKSLEAFHGVSYAPEALAASVLWSARYIADRALPDKSVNIIDLSGARARRRGQKTVGRSDVAEVVAELASIPIERLLETDGERLLRLEELLAKRIVGHSAAMTRIAAVLRRNASGFRSRRPIGSFLLLGPTGVGKTETAKAVAECLFHSQYAMTRLDLSEYAESHAIARLIGAPPGYVGHEAGGQLTEAVARRPYQVVLIDEIEKAHRDVLEAFLQVLDEGRMTDGRGKTVDFSSTVLFFTSNLGADLTMAAPSKRGIGFGRTSGSSDDDAVRDKLLEAARHGLPPELYNRFDEVIAYAPLARHEVAEIAKRLLRALADDLARERDVRLEVEDDAVEALLDAGGFDAQLGARPMRRTIARLIEAPIAEMILRGQLSKGDVALVFADGGQVVVDAVAAKKRFS